MDNYLHINKKYDIMNVSRELEYNKKRDILNLLR